MSKRDVLPVTGLALLALAIRIPHLWDIPRFTDETLDLLWGLRTARGQLLPLTNVDPYNGPLWTYILAAGFLIGGPSLYTARLIVAVLGALAVVPTYLLARDLAGDLIGTRRAHGPAMAAGLLAGTLIALSPVHIVVNSHIAWSNSLTPLFTTFGFWLLYGAVSHDRPRLLLPSALSFGLAVQTHPTAVLLIPGAALFVLLKRWSWFATPWPYLAAGLSLAVYSPVIVEAARNQFAVLGQMSDQQRYYAAGQALSLEVYGGRLVKLFGLLANSLGGALSETSPLISPLEHLPSLAAVIVTLLGLGLAVRRRSPLPFLLIASFAFLLPAASPRYESVVPKARYVGVLLPICYALMALIVVDRFVGARSITRVALAGRAARVGIAGGAVALVIAPLVGLHSYYLAAEAQGLTNAGLFRTIAAIQGGRRTGEPVVLDDKLGYLHTIGGGHMRDHLVFAARALGWPTVLVDAPQPGATIPPETRGLLVLRAGDAHRVSYFYRATPFPDAPADLPVRLYRMKGLQPVAGPAHVEPVATGLSMPASLAFDPDGRLFFNEVVDGRVRILTNDALQDEPFVTLPTPRGREQGALGLTLDPDFARNRWVYVYYSEADGDNRPIRNRVVRFTEVAGRASAATVILGDLPINTTKVANGGNNGGPLLFGPDGKLYVSVGEVAQRRTAPDPEALNGKILRLNPDGSVPDDNPYPGLLPYAAGFRNVWGMAFDPIGGRLYATDNGARGFDELNVVVAGKDYGYPEVEGGAGDPRRYVGPIWHSGEQRLGIVGAAFYTGRLFPEYADDLFFCAFNTGELRRVRLRGPARDRAARGEAIADNCRLGLAPAPDGSIFFSDFTTIYRLTR